MVSTRRAPKPFSDAPADCVSYSERRQQIREISTLPRPELYRWMQSQPVLSRHAQYRLQAHPSMVIRRVLADHPHLLPEVQLLLAGDTNQYVRRVLAKNPALVPDAAGVLHAGPRGVDYENAWPYIVENLAMNPATPLELLWEIEGSIDSEPTPHTQLRWRMGLVANPSFPAGAFEPLEELDYREQFVLGKRPNLDVSMLRRLEARNVQPSVLMRHVPDPVHAALACIWQPQWEGCLGSLLDAVEIDLPALSPAARETAVKLFPGWEGDWPSLRQAAVGLTT